MADQKHRYAKSMQLRQFSFTCTLNTNFFYNLYTVNMEDTINISTQSNGSQISVKHVILIYLFNRCFKQY